MHDQINGDIDGVLAKEIVTGVIDLKEVRYVDLFIDPVNVNYHVLWGCGHYNQKAYISKLKLSALNPLGSIDLFEGLSI